jgi:glycerate 2-kinase
VVTRYDHVPPAWRQQPGRIEVVEAAHPVPDEAGRQAAARIAQLVQGLTADDLVIALISGGGSSLLSLPAPGLTLADKQAVNQALLASGAAIDEMNCLRKHLSAIKGGRLAALAAPAPMVTLLISDVPGDDPSVIASGPTVPDPSTCADALAICRRYRLALPPAAQAGLDSGAFETPKPGDACFAGHAVRMIATPQASLEAAADAARAAGIQAHILSDEIEGESREVGKVHAALARAVARRGQPFARPCVILSGGETTVTVRPRAPGAPKRPRRPCHRVPAGLRHRAAGPGRRACAGGRHRRHRRRAGQRRRHRHARHAGPRRRAGPEGRRAPGRQRRLRLLQRTGRPGAHRAHLHQRQRLPGAADPVTMQ